MSRRLWFPAIGTLVKNLDLFLFPSAAGSSPSPLIGLWFDAEAAQKELRKRGKVLASKKSARTAAEGLLALAQNETKAAVIELNCETDFVARNDIFQYLVSLRSFSFLSCELVEINC